MVALSRATLIFTAVAALVAGVVSGAATTSSSRKLLQSPSCVGSVSALGVCWNSDCPDGQDNCPMSCCPQDFSCQLHEQNIWECMPLTPAAASPPAESPEPLSTAAPAPAPAPEESIWWSGDCDMPDTVTDACPGPQGPEPVPAYCSASAEACYVYNDWDAAPRSCPEGYYQGCCPIAPEGP